MLHMLVRLTVFLLLAAPAATRAHDLWIEPGPGGLVLRHGHRGGELLAIDAVKVKAIRCAGHGGTEPPRDVRPEAAFDGREVVVRARCAAVSAFLDAGYFSLTPDGEVNLPRDRAPDAVKSWRSRQFAKWVDARAPGAAAPLGDALEIVPAGDLSRARRGEKATFRVLLEGKPVAGAVVTIDHRPLGETDHAGEIRVKVRAREIECVSASLRRPLRSAQADADVLEASLAFEVGQ
jgi:nickel transport protein